MPYQKPVTQLIKSRFSCRTYAQRPIEEGTRLRLAQFASSLTVGPFGTQSRFALVAATPQDQTALRGLGTYGFIKGAPGFIIGATSQPAEGLEDFGYLMERIVLFAADLGLGTCWLGGSFTKSTFAQRISARDGEQVPAVVSVGYKALRPHGLDGLIRLGVRADRRLAWQDLFFNGRLDSPLSREAAGIYSLLLDMVRLGPSASNRQPWRVVREGDLWHFFLRRSPGYREGAFRPRWAAADMQRLDLGIAMCHWELTAKELDLEGRWTSLKPDLGLPQHVLEYVMTWQASHPAASH